jgi:hypothetical protein
MEGGEGEEFGGTGAGEGVSPEGEGGGEGGEDGEERFFPCGSVVVVHPTGVFVGGVVEAQVGEGVVVGVGEGKSVLEEGEGGGGGREGGREGEGGLADVLTLECGAG